MNSVGRTDLWLEGLPLLCHRYTRLHPRQAASHGADDLARQVEARAAHALGQVDLAPAPALRTARDWEVRWNQDREFARLTAFFRRRGIAVVLHRDHYMSPTDLTGLATEEDETIIIDLNAARARVERLRAAGLTLPLNERDGALLMLCEEVYALAVADLPELPPHEALADQVAPHEFARRLLGLPFHPWAADLAGDGVSPG